MHCDPQTRMSPAGKACRLAMRRETRCRGRTSRRTPLAPSTFLESPPRGREGTRAPTSPHAGSSGPGGTSWASLFPLRTCTRGDSDGNLRLWRSSTGRTCPRDRAAARRSRGKVSATSAAAGRERWWRRLAAARIVRRRAPCILHRRAAARVVRRRPLARITTVPTAVDVGSAPVHAVADVRDVRDEPRRAQVERGVVQHVEEAVDELRVAGRPSAAEIAQFQHAQLWVVEHGHAALDPPEVRQTHLLECRCSGDDQVAMDLLQMLSL